MADPKWYDSMTQKGLALCYNCPPPPPPPPPHPPPPFHVVSGR